MLCHKSLPVAENEALNCRYHVLKVRDEDLAAHCAPGMFFELKADGGEELRKLYKPVSVYEVQGAEIAFMIKDIGPGTAALCALEKGSLLKLTGPLGNSFPLVENSSVLLVSGGIGYPPIAYLKKVLSQSNSITHLHGGCTAADVFPCDLTCTDDGSIGREGFVTEAMAELIADTHFDSVYACGPLPMLKAVARLVDPVSCFVSLEAYMACGVGVCHGCAAPVGGGWQRVCKEGPVFRASDVRWEEL